MRSVALNQDSNPQLDIKDEFQDMKKMGNQEEPIQMTISDKDFES